ncbi:hypothetical protein HDU83_000244 [Entophlyctis luteolus]|nr:hypothetical protein HDU82_003430 [Entophlyctis luteolus]KAJ3349868.1 hypothetical protein HDU83_000244 [Entophlyctis luteolus]
MTAEKPSRPTLVSNGEVLAFLRSCEAADHMAHTHNSQHLRTVSFEVTRYLTAVYPAALKAFGPNRTATLIEKLRTSFGLTRAESLMVVNSCPTSPIELYLIIEDFSERLTEEQVDQMLALVQDYLATSADGVETEGNAEAMEDT